MRRNGFPLTRALDVVGGVVAVGAVVLPVLGGAATIPLERAGLQWPLYWVLCGAAAAAALSTPPRRWLAWAPWTFVACWAVLLAWMPYAVRIAPNARAADIEVTRFLLAMLLSVVALALVRGARAGLTGLRLGWLVSLVISASIGLWEITTKEHLLFLDPKRGWVFGDARLATGTFLNPNNFATALVGMIVGVWALRAAAARTPGPTGRIRGGARVAALVVLDLLVLAGAVVVVFTQSRSGLAALAVVAGLEACRRWASWRSWWLGHVGRNGLVADALAGPAPRTRRRLAWGAGTVVAALLVASVTVPALAARNPIVQVFTMAGNEETARSDSLRVQLIAAALRYLRGSGWLGSGAGSFEPLLWADPDPGVIKLTNLHNAFVELLSQYGVVVGAVHTAALLALVAVVVWPLPGRRRAAAAAGGAGTGGARPARAGSTDARAHQPNSDDAATPRPGSPGSPRRGLPTDHRVEIAGYLAAYIAFGVAASSALTVPTWWLLHASACASWWVAATSGTPIHRREPSPATARPQADAPSQSPSTRAESRPSCTSRA